MAKVVKTRIEAFPDEDVFEWCYDAIKKRYDSFNSGTNRPAGFAGQPGSGAQIKELLNVVRLPDGLVDKWFAKARSIRGKTCPPIPSPSASST